MLQATTRRSLAASAAAAVDSAPNEQVAKSEQLLTQLIASDVLRKLKAPGNQAFAVQISANGVDAEGPNHKFDDATPMPSAEDLQKQGIDQETFNRVVQSLIRTDFQTSSRVFGGVGALLKQDPRGAFVGDSRMTSAMMFPQEKRASYLFEIRAKPTVSLDQFVG